MKIKNNIAISDSGFIFNPDTGESFTTNPMGMEVLEMLREGLEFEPIRKKILNKYSTDKDTVEKDFFDFVQLLHQFNLIADDGREKN